MAEVPRVLIVTLLVPVTFGLACNLSPAGIDRLISCWQYWQSSLEASPKQHLSWAETVRSQVIAEFSQPVVEFPLAFLDELVEIEVQSDGLILCLVNGMC